MSKDWEFTHDMTFTASDYSNRDMEQLEEFFAALGLAMTFSPNGKGTSASVTIQLPITQEVKRRQGGKPHVARKPPFDSPLIEPTCGDVVKYERQHGATETARAVGLTRATYYRRRKKIFDAKPETPLDYV